MGSNPHLHRDLVKRTGRTRVCSSRDESITSRSMEAEDILSDSSPPTSSHGGHSQNTRYAGGERGHASPPHRRCDPGRSDLDSSLDSDTSTPAYKRGHYELAAWEEAPSDTEVVKQIN